MPIELLRIDERLLHGQVVVGWGERLGLRWYVVADDDLATETWEQEIYAGGLPDGVEARFLPVSRAVGELPELDRRPEPGAVLTRGTAAMRRLAESGRLAGRRINLGCLGASDDRREALEYLHLSRDEAEDLRELHRRGAEVVARDVPGARAVRLPDLLAALDGG